MRKDKSRIEAKNLERIGREENLLRLAPLIETIRTIVEDCIISRLVSLLHMFTAVPLLREDRILCPYMRMLCYKAGPSTEYGCRDSSSTEDSDIDPCPPSPSPFLHQASDRSRLLRECSETLPSFVSDKGRMVFRLPYKFSLRKQLGIEVFVMILLSCSDFAPACLP